MSPADTPDQHIKRATIVYGRRSNHLPLPPDAVPTDERSSERARTCEVPPRPRQSSLSPSIHASDTERSQSPNAADTFQFGFRHRLKELDEEFDDCNVPGPSPSRQAGRAVLSQVKDFQRVSMDTATLSPKAHRSSGGLSRIASSPSPTSLHAISDQEHPESPLVRRRAPIVPYTATSDSEVEESSHSSSLSPVRHAITTPHSRSSPTPPTSGEFLMGVRKTKGKAPARDVLPLIFDAERPPAAEPPVKSKKSRRSEQVRPKTKAPTKKERREAAFESSRIAANRPVEVIRTQEQKHSLSAFFAGLRRDNIITPTSGTELPSDPIEKFSSPTDRSTRVLPLNSVFGVPTGLLGSFAHVEARNQPSSSSSKSTKAPSLTASDSDDEMPSVTSLVQRETGKQLRLREMKQVALRHADTSKPLDISNDDDDDDLLIVKDDMQVVAREEAAQRRLDKVHGSPVKDMVTLRRINHPSVRPPVVSPHKLSKQELHELAKPSFARMGKGSKGQLTKKQLDQLMIMQHTEEQLKSIKRHEEEWIKGGGKLSRDIGGDSTQPSLSQKLEAYAEQGLKVVGTGDMVEDAEESDEEYTPDLRGSVSPRPMDAEEYDSDDMKASQVLLSQVHDDEEAIIPLRHHKFSKRRPRVFVGSDDEEEQIIRHNLSGVPRDCASSMESQTEDENDKENSVKLMYDRSEDKENKAVVRHEPSLPDMTFGSGLGFQHGTEDGFRGSLSLASVADFNDTSSPREDTRLPLKDISKEEDDLFLSPPPANSSFTKRLLHGIAILPPRSSTSTLSLGSPPILRGQRFSRINPLSLELKNDENDSSGFNPPQPSFLERLRGQVGPGPCVNQFQNSGLSQLFSAEDGNLTKPVGGAENDELSLTLDVGLKPALEVSGTLMQKAENIFEKEQEYVVAAAVQQSDGPKEVLYVDDHGFLTQTRPEGSSPQAYCMIPSQASKLVGTQIHSTGAEPLSTRPPLRTLSLTISQEWSPEPQPLRRLRKRSSSPLEQKFFKQDSKPVTRLNAFSILGKAVKPPSKAQKEKLQRSEFVAVEAEESDEDDMFGFGGQKKDDNDDDDDNNEQDKVVEGLVDDTAMDAETEAVDLVLEKHREHKEEDDQQLQKLHQDAVEGKFRMKRRGRGVDVEDDSDDDDDDDARRIRQRIHKKRKIEGDSLEALGQNEETRAFYNTYHQDLVDEDEFGHLREDTAIPADDDDVPAEEPQHETISVDEIRQRVREIARNDSEVEVLDPEDTSWIDQSMTIEIDDAVRVKVVEYRRSESMARHPNAMEFDTEPKRHTESEQERKQMKSWAKDQSHQRQGTGRSGNSTAVTGHAKARTGGGSLRPVQPKSVATVSEARKTKAPSLLSTVPNRRGKFA